MAKSMMLGMDGASVQVQGERLQICTPHLFVTQHCILFYEIIYAYSETSPPCSHYINH